VRYRFLRVQRKEGLSDHGIGALLSDYATHGWRVVSHTASATEFTFVLARV
jgi:hypothetical protein